MATLEVSCKNQKLKWDTEPEQLFSGNIKIDGITFSFCPLWEGFIKTAVFYKEGQEPFHILLDENNTCFIPHEVTETNGLIYCGVFGVKGDCRRTTEVIAFYLDKGIPTEGTPSEPTPDIYQQILSVCNETYKIASTLRDETDNGAKRAEAAADNAEASEEAAEQAFKDLLEMIQSGQIATLIDGKIPVENIPSIATTEIHTATSEAEMKAIEAQRGDICIRTDELKSYIFNNTWTYLVAPTDYAARAGHADTATNATNANTINGHRLIEMTAEEFESAVKDEDTYYLVY